MKEFNENLFTGITMGSSHFLVINWAHLRTPNCYSFRIMTDIGILGLIGVSQ